jgi:hypothetical protein
VILLRRGKDMEKRRFTRVPVQAKATLITKDATVQGDVENLSLRGMYLHGYQSSKIGEEVEVDIFIPDTVESKHLKTKAVAVRYHDGGTGFQFGSMDFDSFFILQEIIARLSGAPGQVMTEVMRFVNEG